MGSCLIRIFFSLFVIFFATPSYAQKQGQAAIDSLLKELPKQKEDTNKVNLLDGLSSDYNSINHDEGIKYGQQAVELALRLSWRKGIAITNNCLGDNYLYKSDYSRALRYFQKALKIDEEIKNKNGVATVTRNIGAVYIMQSDFPKGLEYYFKALKMNEDIGDKNGIVIITAYIGEVYLQIDCPKALEYYFKALKMAEEIGNKSGIAIATEGIGNAYNIQSNFSKAFEYYLKALKTDEEIGDKEGIARVAGNIGIEYAKQKNYVMAMENFQKSLKIAKELGSKYGVAFNLCSIGTCFLSIIKDTSGKSKNDPALKKYIPIGGKAVLLHNIIDYFQQSIVISKEIYSPQIIQECYENLAEAYKLSGDYKKSLEAADNYHAIKDSVFSQENNKKIIQQGMKFEYEKKEAVAKVEQEKKDAIAGKEIQKQKLVRNGFVGGFAVVLLFAGIFFGQRNKIKEGKKKSDELLLNILPAEVAEELKAKGSAEAKLIDEVTVLFTDFKGFTQLSEKLSPKALVAEINDCFSAFDNIMQKYGVEKIKTIGDSYMAAGGLPTPNKTHPGDVVKSALEIQQFMQEHNKMKEAVGEPFFEIRIGIHSGSVVAGIVGVKKFAYDIWGDTVNTAARMEQNSEAGKINISQTTYELVKDKFSCEYRGEIDAKGKGMLKMYFVT